MLFFALSYLLFTTVTATKCNLTQSIYCTKNPYNPCVLIDSSCGTLNKTWYCFQEQTHSVCTFSINNMDSKTPFIDKMTEASQPGFKYRTDDVFDECFYSWYHGITRGRKIEDFCKNYEPVSEKCLVKTTESPCAFIPYFLNMTASLLKSCGCEHETPTVAEAGKIMASRKFVEDLISASFVDLHVPKHQLGPDYIIPTTDNRTWIPDGAVQIEVPENCDSRYEPESMISLFRRAVENSPNKTADRITSPPDCSPCFPFLIESYSNGNHLGLIPYHGVAILSSNSPEWLISYLAAMFCGGFPAGIYTTNSPDACYHVLNDSSANIILVENEFQLEKIQAFQNQLPNLKAIVQINGQSNRTNVISWQELLLIGQSLSDEILNKRIKGLAINQCCNLVYTSGTTGNPKGVMLSHDNLISMIKTMCYEFWHTPKFGITVSYLPLSHVAALIVDVLLAILTESTVYFANPNALKGDVIEDLIEAKPTYFLGVPRVYEKLKVKLEVMEEALSLREKSLVTSARKQALMYNQEKFQNSEPILYSAAKAAILTGMKKEIGFDKTKLFVCAGAPLSNEVNNFLASYDISLTQAYGLSETTGPHISIGQNKRLGSVGNVKELKYFETKILDPDSDGEGEILLRGRDIFMGYLKLEEMTKETLDEDKWLHTGDIGEIDKDGFLFITGRIKELIITSGGENIPPIVIESTVKKLLPVLSNCMLVGDRRKYLTMLLTLNTEVNPGTMEPNDELNVTAIKWCKSVGSSAKRVSEILQTKDPKVLAAIQNGIDKYNENFAFSRPQKIQKWTILSQDFCIHNGTLGPTSKLKRPVVINKYADVIEAMYSS
uniref:long-chain-fatty-acid--CoA ligase n=1 Tax=Strigamia maritima TaxID=126957 RepID=T1J839_STRMM